MIGACSYCNATPPIPTSRHGEPALLGLKHTCSVIGCNGWRMRPHLTPDPSCCALSTGDFQVHPLREIPRNLSLHLKRHPRGSALLLGLRGEPQAIPTNTLVALQNTHVQALCPSCCLCTAHYGCKHTGPETPQLSSRRGTERPVAVTGRLFPGSLFAPALRAKICGAAPRQLRLRLLCRRCSALQRLAHCELKCVALSCEGT